MNQDILQGKLREMRGELKRKWGKLTNNDLRQIEGELDRIVGLFQKRYGYTREQAISEVENYVQEYGARARDTLRKQTEALQQEPARALPVVWSVMAVVGIIMLMMRLRR